MRWSKFRTRTIKRRFAYDTFTRADGLVGTSEGGQVWTTSGGTFSVASNRMSGGVASGQIAYITLADASDSVTSIRLVSLIGGMGVHARRGGPGGQKHYLAQYDTSANVVLSYFDGSAFNVLATVSGASTGIAAGKFLRLRCKGSSIKVLVDSTVVISVTDSNVLTGTWFGVRSGSATGGKLWDDFSVWSV